MKSISKIGYKLIAVAVFVLGSFVIGTVSFSSSDAHASIVKKKVTDQQVIEYLNREGYTVYSLTPSGENRIADTQYNYDTIVYIEDGIIIGHEDMI